MSARVPTEAKGLAGSKGSADGGRFKGPAVEASKHNVQPRLQAQAVSAGGPSVCAAHGLTQEPAQFAPQTRGGKGGGEEVAKSAWPTGRSPATVAEPRTGVEGAVEAEGCGAGECAERRGRSRPQGRAAEAGAEAALDTKSKECDRARPLELSALARRSSRASTRALRLCTSARNSRQKEAR